MALGDAILLLIKEDFNLLLTEILQLCNNKTIESIDSEITKDDGYVLKQPNKWK